MYIEFENVHHFNIKLLMMLLGHLPIYIWILKTFAYGIQVKHTLVVWNLLSFANKNLQNFYNLRIVPMLGTLVDSFSIMCLRWVIADLCIFASNTGPAPINVP